MWYEATYLKEASIVSDGILSTRFVELQNSRSLASVSILRVFFSKLLNEVDLHDLLCG